MTIVPLRATAISAAPLTESIQNLRQMGSAVSKISGLPDGAKPIKQRSVTSVDRVVTATETVQKNALGFVDPATEWLKKAAAAVEDKDMESLQQALQGLKPLADRSRQTVDAAAGEVQNEVGEIAGSVASLTTISSELAGEKVALDARVKTLQAKADEIDKKKYYYLLLGPFGLVGLGIMTGLLVDALSKVSDARGKAQTNAAHSAQVGAAMSAVQGLSDQLRAIQVRLNSVSNAVDIVASDIAKDLELIHDGKVAEDPTLASLFVQAALRLVDSIRQDAA